MTAVSFDGQYPRDRRVIVTFCISQLVLIPIISGLALFAKGGFRWSIPILAATDFITILAFLAYIYFRYRTQPQVIEKVGHQKELRELQREHQVARVADVTEGNTIGVYISGQYYQVRYIGVDAPKYPDYYSYQSTIANRNLVEGKTVTLVKDLTDTDSSERLLRYVLVGDVFVNYELIRDGYARAYSYGSNTACRTAFSQAQSAARSAKDGMWMPTPTPWPTSPPSGGGGSSRGPSPTASSGNCDPSYPTVCIPPPPPDLDCGDIPYRRFKVLQPDPHNFDGDHDGIGCESG